MIGFKKVRAEGMFEHIPNQIKKFGRQAIFSVSAVGQIGIRQHFYFDWV